MEPRSWPCPPPSRGGHFQQTAVLDRPLQPAAAEGEDVLVLADHGALVARFDNVGQHRAGHVAGHPLGGSATLLCPIPIAEFALDALVFVLIGFGSGVARWVVSRQ